MFMLRVITVTFVKAIIVIAITGSNVYSAGFQISEVSVTGLGRGFAGAGISGDGPSDLFHNPSGLMLNSGSQIELGLYVIDPNADYRDNGSNLNLLTAAGPIAIAADGIESNGGETAFVPNAYYATDINQNTRFGIGLASPYGLTTEYDANWIGRYHAIKSELITVEVNPVIAHRINDNLSVGGGVTLLKADADLSQAQFMGPGIADGLNRVEGDDTAVGFTLGLMVGDENSRFGFGYRSAIDIEVEGTLSITPIGITAGAEAEITLPATAYISGFKKLGEKLDLLASIRWTDWSEFDELRVDFDNGLPSAITPQNWQDSYTYSIGLNYRKSDHWAFRLGYARDQTPISDDEFRTPRIPDTDRDWLSVGASYQATKKVRIDLSYAHLFTDSAPITESLDLISTMPGVATSNLNGSFQNTSANIYGIQVHINLSQ